ncbi:cob(I)yrinic acid a,c-diamide adenosyltransferase [Veillonella sp.]|uniref:cob(I)yrinic acid a,c-diamide adenosyltransferase n=1 Tax=Veillonella sp. TaxID=1926307 RepID=UPI0028FE0FB0|nr:cob(I)yrinic acid a,c-diamide adenosyltransferase [Veillonella sp.]MDU2410378.1 cob(I)yrinic acid a,c-diamide adenosyltransferase [Veillonella sp.]
MEERGLILVNTGNGKGKTTAALGVVLRAVGQGFKVLILQFIKSGNGYGELAGLAKLGNQVEIRSMGKGFIYYNRNEVGEAELARHKEAAQAAWRTLVEEVNSDKWDLIVMDEINNAINYELIDVNSVVEMLKNKPKRLHVVLTGRYAKPEIIDMADTVTEMKVVKHAYEKGIKAAKGIEF